MVPILNVSDAPRNKSCDDEKSEDGTHAFTVVTGDDSLEVLARDFRVMNANGETLFAANRREVVVGADILRVSGRFLFST